MESASVLKIYQHSERLYNIHCRPFIGDGDSSSYSLIDKTRPYSPMIVIEKLECTNHVTKRMGSGLRKLLQSYKGICAICKNSTSQKKCITTNNECQNQNQIVFPCIYAHNQFIAPPFPPKNINWTSSPSLPSTYSVLF